MIFSIVLSMLGVFNTVGNNVNGYNDVSSYTYSIEGLGPSYKFGGDLYISRFQCDVDGTFSFNSQDDYTFNSLGFEFSLTYYQVTGDDTWVQVGDVDVVSYSLPSSTLFTNYTIDEALYYIQFDYSDNIEWTFYNPLHSNQREEYVTGSFNSHGGEVDNYLSYRYYLDFTHDFKSNFLQYIRSFSSNQSAYNQGYNVGLNTGYTNGYNEGEASGYQNGYADGLLEGTDRNATATTIFTGILQVGLLPVNVFLAIFNFEVFGINIGGFLASLMTIAIIVIVIRIIVGAKTGS